MLILAKIAPEVVGLVGLAVGAVITGFWAFVNNRAERLALKPYKDKELAIDGLDTSVKNLLLSIDRLERDNVRLDGALAACLARDTEKALLLATQATQISAQATQISDLNGQVHRLRDRMDARNGINDTGEHPAV